MTTWKFEFINPSTQSLHFAEGGFLSANRALDWARHALAIDRRWADDTVAQTAIGAAARWLATLDQAPVTLAYDLRLVIGDNGEQPIALRLQQE